MGAHGHPAPAMCPTHNVHLIYWEMKPDVIARFEPNEAGVQTFSVDDCEEVLFSGQCPHGCQLKLRADNLLSVWKDRL